MSQRFNAEEILEGPIETILSSGFYTIKVNNQELIVKAEKNRFKEGQWVAAAFSNNEIGQIIGLSTIKAEVKATRYVSIV